MSAGMLNDRVDFQSKTVVPDGGGGGAETWSTDCTVWANYKPQRGGESIETGSFEGVNRGVLKVRSTPDTRAITERHTVVIDGERYSIVSPPINPDRRDHYIEMIVQRGGAVG